MDARLNIKTKFIIKKSFDIEGFLSIKNHLNIVNDPAFILPTDAAEVIRLVDEAHMRAKDTITKQTGTVEILWRSKEDSFSKLAVSLFAPADFPDHEYQCYPTIWPLIARDPVKHRIAFPYNCPGEEACYVIAHELLHELFYIHLDRVFGKDIDLNSTVVWDISEIINVFIMQDRDWQKVFTFPAIPYPQHQNLFDQLLPVWDKDKNIDALVTHVRALKLGI